MSPGALRDSEWITAVCLAFVLVVSFFFPLSGRRRWLICLLNPPIVVSLCVLAGAQSMDSPLLVSVVRDWIQAPLILVVYYEAGMCIFPRPDRRFERLLQAGDRLLLEGTWLQFLRGPLPRWLDEFLELCYLLCYPVVPLGLAGLYVARLGRFADEFWSAVLPALFLCYILSLFFPAVPPRALGAEREAWERRSSLRRLNVWILDRAGVGANVFPSAHVAGAVATSLAVTWHLPLLGMAYSVIAIGILLGSVRGRYHYAADAVLGTLVAAGVFTAQALWFR